MIGSNAIIAKPGEPRSNINPGKYLLRRYAESAIDPLPDEQQTLINPNFYQDDERTVLSFTKYLVEEGERPISMNETNSFIFAVGSDNNFAYHRLRGVFDLQLTPCRDFVSYAPSASPSSVSPTKEPSATPTLAPVRETTRDPSTVEAAPSPTPLVGDTTPSTSFGALDSPPSGGIASLSFSAWRLALCGASILAALR